VKASQPFDFYTASYLVRLSGQEAAGSLLELKKGMATCGDACIFYHTFQSLGRHHFLGEGFSNDFAQWVFSSCNRPQLAERLASLDIRDYVSLAQLRADLQHMLEEYCGENPREAALGASEKFYFCETIEEEVPLGVAWTLEEFRDRMKKLPHAALQFHFLTSRLRLHLRSNDFSQWFSEVLGLETLARNVDRLDVYTNTLDGIRDRIVTFVEREVGR
jgi:Family of unknown function (DUF5752)